MNEKFQDWAETALAEALDDFLNRHREEIGNEIDSRTDVRDEEYLESDVINDVLGVVVSGRERYPLLASIASPQEQAAAMYVADQLVDSLRVVIRRWAAYGTFQAEPEEIVAPV